MDRQAKASKLLRGILPATATQIRQQAVEDGVTKGDIRTAREALKAEAVQVGCEWVWVLPPRTDSESIQPAIDWVSDRLCRLSGEDISVELAAELAALSVEIRSLALSVQSLSA